MDVLKNLLMTHKGWSLEQWQAFIRDMGSDVLALTSHLMTKGILTQDEFDLLNQPSTNQLNPHNLKTLTIDPVLIKRFPARYALHYKVMPLRLAGQTLSLATQNPEDLQMIDDLRVVLPWQIEPVAIDEPQIMDLIRKYYGLGAETIDAMMSKVDEKVVVNDNANLDETDSEASISKFLNQIIRQAVRDRATDIHIEPYESELHIRYRIDGVMVDAAVPPNIRHFKDEICARIKILSHLDIAEKRVPQDGRFKIRTDKGQEVDLRVSFMPTPYGESVVLRLLNTTALISINDLGMSIKERQVIQNLLSKSHGIIFLTGPTGSGKTTTLYACLASINNEDKKIITIEDPIEYRLKGITQIQVNNKVGLTFAKGLRSLLRHDPDVMMVGEVRDQETADIAIQVALTGHLILSTLHTNDAPSGVTRLLDMGIEPYHITSSVECFIAQRLIRVLCPQCRVPDEKAEEWILAYDGPNSAIKPEQIYIAQGCELCRFTGYTGRQVIYEMMPLDDELRALIMTKASVADLRDMAVKKGMKTLRQTGWQKVADGLTSMSEMIRVTQAEGE